MREVNECVGFEDNKRPTYEEVLNNPRYETTIHERIFWDNKRECFVKFLDEGGK